MGKITIKYSEDSSPSQVSGKKRVIDVSKPIESTNAERTSLYPSIHGEYHLDSKYDEGIVSGLDQNTFRERKRNEEFITFFIWTIALSLCIGIVFFFIKRKGRII